MKKLLENFRRYIKENVGRSPLTLDDAETLVKLAQIFEAGNAAQAFAIADTVGLLDDFLDVLFYGNHGRDERILDAINNSKKTGELNKEEADEMFNILDLRSSGTRRRTMKAFLKSPAVEDEALMNKLLDRTDEQWGAGGMFEATVIINIFRNPNTSESILKRIVRLAEKWTSTAGDAMSRRHMWSIMTRLDSEHSGLKANPNVTNAPEGRVAEVGEIRYPGGWSAGTKTINPEWLEWANS